MFRHTYSWTAWVSKGCVLNPSNCLYPTIIYDWTHKIIKFIFWITRVCVIVITIVTMYLIIGIMSKTRASVFLAKVKLFFSENKFAKWYLRSKNTGAQNSRATIFYSYHCAFA